MLTPLLLPLNVLVLGETIFLESPLLFGAAPQQPKNPQKPVCSLCFLPPQRLPPSANTKVASLKRCSSCRIYFYCSQRCQIEHWRRHGHDLVCKAIKRYIGRLSTESSTDLLKEATGSATVGVNQGLTSDDAEERLNPEEKVQVRQALVLYRLSGLPRLLASLPLVSYALSSCTSGEQPSRNSTICEKSPPPSSLPSSLPSDTSAHAILVDGIVRASLSAYHALVRFFSDVLSAMNLPFSRSHYTNNSFP